MEVVGDDALHTLASAGFSLPVRSIIIAGEGCRIKMVNGKRCASNDNLVSASP
jgi:hypothetical protein